MAVKEKILNYLKEQMGKTSLSERTLEGFAISYSAFFSDEDAVTEEALAAICANVKNIEGQYSHDLSIGLEEAKKKIPPTPPTPPPAPPAPPTPPAPNPALEELNARLQKYDDLFEQMKKEREAAAAKQALESLTKDVESGLVAKGCQKGIFLDFALTQIDASKDAASNIELLKEVYDKKMTDTLKSGAFVPQTVTVTASSITQEEQGKLMKDAIEDLRERHKI